MSTDTVCLFETFLEVSNCQSPLHGRTVEFEEHQRLFLPRLSALTPTLGARYEPFFPL